MREAGIIFEVKKVTGSPILVAQKPGGKIRRKGRVTKKETFPLLIVGIGSQISIFFGRTETTEDFFLIECLLDYAPLPLYSSGYLTISLTNWLRDRRVYGQRSFNLYKNVWRYVSFLRCLRILWICWHGSSREMTWVVCEEGFKKDLDKVRVITGDADP